MSVCHPLLRPAHLEGYDGPSLCDCWYAFHPNAVDPHNRNQGPLNPTYQAGDCPDNEGTDFATDENTACYVRADLRSSFAWPGGCTIVYQIDVFDVTEGWKHAYGSRMTCAACTSRAIRNTRLKLGVIRVENVTAHLHDKGPPVHCDYCEAEMESSYGDPDDESEDD